MGNPQHLDSLRRSLDLPYISRTTSYLQQHRLRDGLTPELYGEWESSPEPYNRSERRNIERQYRQMCRQRRQRRRRRRRRLLLQRLNASIPSDVTSEDTLSTDRDSDLEVHESRVGFEGTTRRNPPVGILATQQNPTQVNATVSSLRPGGYHRSAFGGIAHSQAPAPVPYMSVHERQTTARPFAFNPWVEQNSGREQRAHSSEEEAGSGTISQGFALGPNPNSGLATSTDAPTLLEGVNSALLQTQSARQAFPNESNCRFVDNGYPFLGAVGENPGIAAPLGDMIMPESRFAASPRDGVFDRPPNAAHRIIDRPMSHTMNTVGLTTSGGEHFAGPFAPGSQGSASRPVPYTSTPFDPARSLHQPFAEPNIGRARPAGMPIMGPSSFYGYPDAQAQFPHNWVFSTSQLPTVNQPPLYADSSSNFPLSGYVVNPGFNGTDPQIRDPSAEYPESVATLRIEDEGESEQEDRSQASAEEAADGDDNFAQWAPTQTLDDLLDG